MSKTVLYLINTWRRSFFILFYMNGFTNLAKNSKQARISSSLKDFSACVSV